MARIRAWLTDLWVALKPLRFSLLVLVLLWLVLRHSGQGQDALVYVGERTADGRWPGIFLVAMTIIFGVYMWFVSRRAVSLRFEREVPIMLRYRTDYPTEAAVDAGPARSREKLMRDRRAAKRRVRFILILRKVAPRLIGTVAILIVAHAVYHAVDVAAKFEGASEATAEALRRLALWLVVLAIPTLAFLWFRRWIVGEVLERAPGVGWLKWFEVDKSTVREVRASLADVPRRTKVIVAILAGIPLAIWTAGLLAPNHVGGALGSVPVFFAALTVAAVAGTALVVLARRSNAPVITAVALVMIIGNFLIGDYAVRTVDSSESRTPLGEAVDLWFGDVVVPALGLAFKDLEAATCRSDEASLPPPPAEPVPLVLIAAGGGGIRGAYWTATVLAHLQHNAPALSRHLFALSGVSGGSLGATVYLALLRVREEPAAAGVPFGEAAQAVLNQDFLAPPLAALTSGDVLRFVAPIFHDRGRALERAWERGFKHAAKLWGSDGANPLKAPFLSLWRGRRPWPALALNGTIVETGEPIVVTNLIAELGDGVPIVELHALIDGDVKTSHAVNHSARFPVLGPAARIDVAKDHDRLDSIRVVDGGYFDNFGATTLRLLRRRIAERLGRCEQYVRWIIVQISSDPTLDARLRDDAQAEAAGKDDRVRATRWLPQARAPFLSLFNARTAHGHRAVEALEADVGADDLFVHLHMCGAPDADEDPPLGWALSQRARQEIAAYLTDPDCAGRKARQVIEALKR